jgi:hypothetical protein
MIGGLAQVAAWHSPRACWLGSRRLVRAVAGVDWPGGWVSLAGEGCLYEGSRGLFEYVEGLVAGERRDVGCPDDCVRPEQRGERGREPSA